MTDAQIKRLSNLAPRWFEDYCERAGADERQAMLDDARHWLTHSDPTDPDIADWYRGINADAAKAVAYLESISQ